MRPRDRERFTAYMLSRWTWLMRLAYGLTGDSDLASGVARATLAGAYAAWPQVRREENPDAHVLRILVRTSSRLAPRRPGGRPLPRPPGAAAGQPGEPEGSTDRPEPLLPSLAALTPRQRAVVVLRYWEDLPDAQVAAALRCTRATVRAEAGQALAALRRSGALASPVGGSGA